MTNSKKQAMTWKQRYRAIGGDDLPKDDPAALQLYHEAWQACSPKVRAEIRQAVNTDRLACDEEINGDPKDYWWLTQQWLDGDLDAYHEELEFCRNYHDADQIEQAGHDLFMWLSGEFLRWPDRFKPKAVGKIRACLNECEASLYANKTKKERS